MHLYICIEIGCGPAAVIHTDICFRKDMRSILTAYHPLQSCPITTPLPLPNRTWQRQTVINISINNIKAILPEKMFDGMVTISASSGSLFRYSWRETRSIQSRNAVCIVGCLVAFDNIQRQFPFKRRTVSSNNVVFPGDRANSSGSGQDFFCLRYRGCVQQADCFSVYPVQVLLYYLHRGGDDDVHGHDHEYGRVRDDDGVLHPQVPHSVLYLLFNNSDFTRSSFPLSLPGQNHMPDKA